MKSRKRIVSLLLVLLFTVLAAIVLVRKLTGGSAWPTLAGVLVFGLLQYLAAP